MSNNPDTHLFAVYVGDLFKRQSPPIGATVPIADEALVHRMVTVLRLQSGQQLILFDDRAHYKATFIGHKKNKEAQLTLESNVLHAPLGLALEFYLPLLKKEALEEVIYSLTEIGARSIQLMVCQKSQKQLSDKDLARLHKIKIAAAEQSKQFAMPLIKNPLTFDALCTAHKKNGTPGIVFDPAGAPAFEVMSALRQQKIQTVSAMIGPEGGLTADEIQQALRSGFATCALTQTTLRALQAAAVGAGLLTSLL